MIKTSNILKFDSEGSIPAEVAAQLKRLIQKLNFSQNQLAQKIGVSSSVLSQILTGEYDYNPDNFVWLQVFKFLEKADSKIYETKCLRTIWRMLNQAYKDKEIAVITSVSGAGKTTAIEQYCLMNHYAVHIRVTEVFKVKYMLQKMMQSIGAEYLGMNSQQMFESLSDALQRKERLFVIDEADRLNTSELELLRDFFDQGNIGLCLVGLETLRLKLRKGESLKENLVQLYSRVAYQKVVDILEPDDVKMILADKFPKNKISKEKYAELSKRFKNHGGLRAIIKLANLAGLMAERNGISAVDDELISDAIRELVL